MGCARFRPLRPVGVIEPGSDVKGRTVQEGNNLRRLQEAERPVSTDDREADDLLPMSIFDGAIYWDELPENAAEEYQWDCLGNVRQHNAISDANHLYASMMAARKGTAWKGSVQRFCWQWMKEITRLQQQLDALESGENNAYQPKDGPQFFANERGNIRPVEGQVMADRVVAHSLIDFELMPKIFPHLIYDNAASIAGRGVEFARKRMKAHLTRFYQREGTNIGYIRLKDQSKYYDNIDHDLAYEMLCGFTENALARKLVQISLKHAELDVSDLSDELFERAKNEKFDRVKWRLGNHPKGGVKYLRKGVSVGDQLSQTIGISFPWRVDNEARIVQGSRYYARYMDDSYDIDISLDRLKARAESTDRRADEIRLFTNKRKTVYCRIDKWFIYLQRKFRLNADGTVEMKILPKTLTRFRRRTRKMQKYVESGKLTPDYIANVTRSWLFARHDVMSYPQTRRIELMILELYGRNAYERVCDRTGRWTAT